MCVCGNKLNRSSWMTHCFTVLLQWQESWIYKSGWRRVIYITKRRFNQGHGIKYTADKSLTPANQLGLHLSETCLFVISLNWNQTKIVIWLSMVNNNITIVILHCALKIVFKYNNILFCSAIKWLIAMNRIQNKSFYLHNVCVLCILLCIFKKNMLYLYIWNQLY